MSVLGKIDFAVAAARAMTDAELVAAVRDATSLSKPLTVEERAIIRELAERFENAPR